MQDSYEQKINNISKAFHQYYSENKPKEKKKDSGYDMACRHYVVETKDDYIVYVGDDGNFYKLGYSGDSENPKFQDLSKSVEMVENRDFVPAKVDLKKKMNKLRNKMGKSEYDSEDEFSEKMIRELEKEADLDTFAALKKMKMKKKKKEFKKKLYE